MKSLTLKSLNDWIKNQPELTKQVRDIYTDAQTKACTKLGIKLGTYTFPWGETCEYWNREQFKAN